jgi:hypothetical protein
MAMGLLIKFTHSRKTLSSKGYFRLTLISTDRIISEDLTVATPWDQTGRPALAGTTASGASISDSCTSRRR